MTNKVNLNNKSLWIVPLYTIKNYFNNIENNYFLLLSVIQLLTLWILPRDLSPTGPYSTFIPLVLCVILEIVIDMNDWIKNWKQSNKINNTVRTCISHDNMIYEKKNMDLKIGEIIRLNKGDICPIDGVVIYQNNISEYKISRCMLSGESANEYVFAYRSQNDKYNNFFVKNDKIFHENDEIDEKSIVESGSIIQSEYILLWIIKLSSNSQIVKKCIDKSNTYLEKHIAHHMMNISLKILLILIFIFSLIISTSFMNFLYLNIQGLILFNGIIPFSVKVLLFLMRKIQSIHFNYPFITINNPNIIDELACINHIVSDKTGTLTTNNLSLHKKWYHSEILDIAINLCINKTLNDYDSIEDKALCIEKPNEEYEYVHSNLSFTCERKMSSVIVKKNNINYLFSKGAVSKFNEILKPSDVEIMNSIILNINKSESNLRILAYGYKIIHDTESKDIESNLGFLGLVGLIDPLQDGVVYAIGELHENGMKISMATGDQRITALSIAEEIGILSDNTLILNGEELKKYEEISNNVILYQASTEDKKRLVNILQKSNIVASIGDGFNDIGMMNASNVSVCVKHSLINESLWPLVGVLIEKFEYLPILIKEIGHNAFKNNMHIINANFYRATIVSIILFLNVINSNKIISIFDGFTLKGFTLFWPTMNLLLIGIRYDEVHPKYTLHDIILAIITAPIIYYNIYSLNKEIITLFTIFFVNLHSLFICKPKLSDFIAILSSLFLYIIYIFFTNHQEIYSIMNFSVLYVFVKILCFISLIHFLHRRLL